MTVIEIVLNPAVLAAALAYGAAAVAGIWLHDSVRRTLRGYYTLQWLWERLAAPLLRAGLMLIFLLLAYPVLFGLHTAPALHTLLARDPLRVNTLLNLLFVITLLFPLLPMLGERDELVLPIQGVTASLLLFSWLAGTMGMSVHYWPGWTTVLIMLVLALVSYRLAMTVAATAGNELDRRLNVANAGELLSRALLLFLQYPVIIVFCQGLGKQLA